MDGWTDVTETETTPMEYLVSIGGLSEADASAIVEKAGVGSVEDLVLLDDEHLFQEVLSEAGIKLIPAKKLKNAVQALIVQKRNGNEESVEPGSASRTAPDECIVVAIDRSASMGCGFDEAKAFGANAEKTLACRSRMDAVKQCFYAFRDRTETLEDAHHYLGLIQFDNHIDQMLSLTSDLDRFETVVDDMERRGSTAIYSAIVEGCRMLQPYKCDKTDLRVLVLTDGQNNSGVSPQEALRQVQEIGAVVDAILVGDTPDTKLRKIVTATGGTCFQIGSLSEGFELMEAEAVVSLRSRRGGSNKPVFRGPPEPVDFDTIPIQSITSANQAAKVSSVTPSEIKKTAPKLVHCAEFSLPPTVKGTLKRIAKELKNQSGNEKNGIHIYADVNNLHHMKALIEGVEGTPFDGGIFLVDIVLPADYPFKPPKIRFETPIHHCNVNADGGICLDILQHRWSPALKIESCLLAIRDFLASPNTDDALRPSIAELYFAYRQSGGSDTRYIDQAKTATKLDASRTVEEWNKLWGISKKAQE